MDAVELEMSKIANTIGTVIFIFPWYCTECFNEDIYDIDEYYFYVVRDGL
jgi:hypothetical protein